MSGSGESCSPRLQGSEDSSTRLQSVPQISAVILSSVRPYGETQLDLKSHPVGSSAPETMTMALQRYGSDQPVCTIMLIRPVGPTPTASAMAGPLFLSPFRRIQPSLRMPPPIWGILRFTAPGPGPVQNSASISVVWSLKRCPWLHVHHWTPVLQCHQVMIASVTLRQCPISTNREGLSPSPYLF